jgi:molybdopterin molybdotransferase
MKDSRTNPIPVEEALRIVLQAATSLPIQSVPLSEASGRVLAEEILTDADQPPFPKAMMDGFALRSADLGRLPAELAVVEEIPAGRLPSRGIGPGEASRIMTGAPLPEGADAVQMMERTEPAEGGKVRILEAVAPGANIAPRGQEMRSGDRILFPGDRLTAPRLGLLASVGHPEVSVRRIPAVSLAVTGDELVEAGKIPAPGQIRNSNGPAVAARLRGLGAQVTEMGIVPDRPEALRETIRRGLRDDMLLLSGGVSMGDRDFVEGALEEEGVEILFRKVAIRPGKPAVFGRKGSCLVFGLPGNPVSSLVILEVLAAPALRKMMGHEDPEGRRMEAELVEEVRQHPGRTGYLPGTLSFLGALARVRPIPTRGSADLLAHSRADALFIVPADRSSIGAGERVRVLVLE